MKQGKRLTKKQKLDLLKARPSVTLENWLSERETSEGVVLLNKHSGKRWLLDKIDGMLWPYKVRT
ncbi:DUF6906 family protein [Paenibacillus xylanexedens]|uniref:DUF6906 domain-containing protein n=1 Tax=Paenibacillus xylanexedens TaxID=528191 RepID=A0ABS4S2I1_PAEXY|nr:hypothetical protein [Paenibacillus xylanexedens]MBP2249325.1 hypothetical protein [Paenibacillus xylanexedens]